MTIIWRAFVPRFVSTVVCPSFQGIITNTWRVWASPLLFTAFRYSLWNQSVSDTLFSQWKRLEGHTEWMTMSSNTLAKLSTTYRKLSIIPYSWRSLSARSHCLSSRPVKNTRICSMLHFFTTAWSAHLTGCWKNDPRHLMQPSSWLSTYGL